MTKITKDMGIIDMVEQFPQTVEVLLQNGMGCLGCSAAQFESIEQGATAHGIDVDALIIALNAAIAE